MLLLQAKRYGAFDNLIVPIDDKYKLATLGGADRPFVDSHDFDPARISLEALAARAKQAGVADRIHLPVAAAGSSIAGVGIGAPLDGSYRAAPASDQKKQMEGTPYAGLKLTPEQATKVNAFVRENPAKARVWLSGAQREDLAHVR